MSTEPPVVKHRGDTISIDNTFKDENDALFNPDTQSIQVVDPDGNEMLSPPETNPSGQALGVFRFSYNIPSNATYGVWRIDWTATKGSYTETDPFYFVVVRK